MTRVKVYPHLKNRGVMCSVLGLVLLVVRRVLGPVALGNVMHDMVVLVPNIVVSVKNGD